MTTPSLDTARAVLAALVAAGTRHLVVAPGSRSAPLAYAAAAAHAAGTLQVHVRVDERSAAFTALGIARATGLPAGVVTTSGTAVGNLLPAVMEADHAEAPLVVVSADRPPELRGTGANQTTRQPGIFGDHVRAAVDLVPGDDDGPARLAAAVAALTGSGGTVPAGPVHLNVALREPLHPGPEDGPVLAAWARELQTSPSRLPAGGPGPRRVAAGGVPEPAPGAEEARAVVVAGDAAGPDAARFAEAFGLPLLAEPSSNARSGPNAPAAYRLLLGTALGREVERVLLVGRPTLSRPVAALLARPDVATAAVRPGPVAWYEPGRRRERVLADWAAAAAFTGRGAPGWLAAWQEAGAAADAAVARALATAPLTGPAVAAQVWEACRRDGAVLVAGSSNPVRDLDLAARPAAGSPLVLANRGLAGIDGTVATAAGAALGAGRPVRAFLGDLTFLHDASSLLLGTGEQEPDLQVVVLNDGGGGIFATLEHGALGEQDAYRQTVERFFGTPHTARLAELCAGYGVPHRRAGTAAELAAALAGPVRGRSVVEVPVDRAALRPLHARLRALVAGAVAEAVPGAEA
ncbi:2-succinyl-5-enolpyruvyl-6-hydroxy-3-cyclohexene-1-carboxylate synthase [Kocuria dechangensis]|uniref:2-succinyl-5-enolpyruvyl-6-hydroxy-3-cyclohexene-1-carboxylate synthase n=1 Tax=Kocuria dechangensis TaxID=1176249 RepID=A0A917GSA3_9MICC|nr:2-succinyl-5-enolpyruvyl-6-hydroxy-3-cyclohexene-1-carboxylic-acid synthase [Kocuria dechangensis]GGG55082.1 2-succinyl-5-enolpyruvyl-6-hydroxy-3-cyclohexene-1-carboxylate synthase [Kocuria dechangensis]